MNNIRNAFLSTTDGLQHDLKQHPRGGTAQNFVFGASENAINEFLYDPIYRISNLVKKNKTKLSYDLIIKSFVNADIGDKNVKYFNIDAINGNDTNNKHATYGKGNNASFLSSLICIA